MTHLHIWDISPSYFRFQRCGTCAPAQDRLSGHLQIPGAERVWQASLPGTNTQHAHTTNYPTRADAHARLHARTHTPAHTHAHAQAHAHEPTRTHAHTRTNTHTHTLTYAHLLTRSKTCECLLTRTRTHAPHTRTHPFTRQTRHEGNLTQVRAQVFLRIRGDVTWEDCLKAAKTKKDPKAALHDKVRMRVLACVCVILLCAYAPACCMCSPACIFVCVSVLLFVFLFLCACSRLVCLFTLAFALVCASLLCVQFLMENLHLPFRKKPQFSRSNTPFCFRWCRAVIRTLTIKSLRTMMI